MTGKVIMVQGTASSAGKSILVTALCRIFHQDGYRVAPFKAQNMALNSYVAVDGGEIGRSQAVQAEAAGAEMTVDMNPILLKPEADDMSQVVVRGRPRFTFSAYEYFRYKDVLWPVVEESLAALRSRYEVVVAEGAGSPAEVNLHDDDIVNMRVALAAQAPVVLVADIDRGGVFATLVGTLELLEPAERALVKGLVINKFRGDISLLRSGLDFLEKRTGVPVLGVIPFIHDLGIADEDSVSLEDRQWREPKAGELDIALIHLPHMSNFDDFDPLRREPDVRLRLVTRAEELGVPDLVILPGTKTTMADLDYMRQRGLVEGVKSLRARGVPVIGICGGFQILGARLRDPLGVESEREEAEGLGLLPVETTFEAEKATYRARGTVEVAAGPLAGSRGGEVTGYEIHMGTSLAHCEPAFRIRDRSGVPVDLVDGAVSEDGLVIGTYLHGLFANDGLRAALLAWLAERKGLVRDTTATRFSSEEEYDRLAAVVRESIDVKYIYSLLGLEGR